MFFFDDDCGFIFDTLWISVLYLDKAHLDEATIPVTLDFDLERKNTQ
jgi:hypothetical protein